jgi:ribosomal protein L16 Arg81 hydroxylase
VSDEQQLRDALQSLVAPMDSDEFVEHYWNRRSVYIPGTPDKLAGLFSTQAFHAAIAAAEALPPAQRDGFHITSAVVNPIPAAAVAAEYEAGRTICVSSIHAGDAGLADFAAELKAQLWFPGHVAVHAYLSPPGTGFSFLHFDARIATAVQLEGRKKWRFADRASVPWPVHNGSVDEAGVIQWQVPPTPWERELRPEQDLEWTEVILEPGDFICLPAGTLHQAEAMDEPSLSLNVNFNYRGFLGFITELLDARLSSSSSWRDAPPAVTSAALRSGTFPATVAAFVRARLQEARAELDALDAEIAEAAVLWQQATLPRQGRVEPPAGAVDLQPDDVLRVELASCLRPSEAIAGIALITGRAIVKVPGEHLIPFVQRLVQHRQFVAKSALEWVGGDERPGWSDLKPVLVELVQRGILERVGRQP